MQTDVVRSASARTLARPEKGLILGWNDSDSIIVSELDNYVIKGSSITVVADESLKNGVKAAGKLQNQKFIFRSRHTTDRGLLDEIGGSDLDHATVLSAVSPPTPAAGVPAVIM